MRGAIAGASILAEILRRYFADIREFGQAPDFLVLTAGGVVFVAGLSTSLLDFVLIQRSEWRPEPTTLAGLMALLLGFYLRIQARRTLGRLWSPVARVLPDHALVTQGVYGRIRHPGYLGEFMVFFSVPLALKSGYGLAVMFLLIPFVLYRIGIEEKMLREKFGEEYRDYASRTKRLIPYIY